MAIEEWAKLKDGDSTSLERALAAYDMFVLHNRDGDFDDVYIHKLYGIYESLINVDYITSR